jgi:cytidine deaminase
MSMDFEPIDIDTLIKRSREACDQAYAPYSGFKVGAAVLGGSGGIYCGCNVENSSYGLSICAERSAVTRAICDGERTIKAVAISNSTGKASPPCGACRQVLHEFAPEGEILFVYLDTSKGVETYTLSELLPEAFKLDSI